MQLNHWTLAERHLEDILIDFITLLANIFSSCLAIMSRNKLNLNYTLTSYASYNQSAIFILQKEKIILN